jgi:hypothetical protein
MDDPESVNRVATRFEISEAEKQLSSTANIRGIENYAFFRIKVIEVCII